MKSSYVPIVIVLAAIVLICAACTAQPTLPPQTPTPHAGQALLESRCTVCHPLTIISTVKYDKAGWDFTVKRMVTSGAQLNQDQAEKVIDYLAVTYK